MQTDNKERKGLKRRLTRTGKCRWCLRIIGTKCRYFLFFTHHLTQFSIIYEFQEISFYKIRESCIRFVINEAITNNSKYILVTYKHCSTWTLTSPPAFIFSVKINIFIIQPYAVKSPHHLVSHFPGQTFQCPRASNWSRTVPQCISNVMRQK